MSISTATLIRKMAKEQAIPVIQFRYQVTEAAVADLQASTANSLGCRFGGEPG
jgi:hypothetical protein